MNNIYYRLPIELWVKIVNYSNEISLLVTNKQFFELIVLVDVEVDIIEYIVETNSVDIMRYIMWLKNNSHDIFDKLIVTINSLDSQLVNSCKIGNLSMIKYLIDLDADIKADNDSAVRLASKKGYLEIVKYLVSQGANIRSDNDYAVRLASRKGHLEVVKYLVSQGANIRSDNDYAVKWASENGHLEVVKYLVTQGANIRSGNDYAVKWAS
ncbi:putative ankyrin repeat protein [Acanthamoeba polyphaga mimivirus]|uniref:Ankyrin repeat protein n=1 Tax=Acanthamoeba polyphaga mimivirus Kroon TaxID=3069720 RepID=A0A0G2Y1Z2_9VIRU|nr:putative ankyrin repeat protein [Acanthamoeba polyphaga mimivirus]AKI79733.1 putative ankyrin repeat protein [Acanthamoeba polyphaga mimivirus Kroon]